jgi:predicted branched-subunit amino acid permease
MSAETVRAPGLAGRCRKDVLRQSVWVGVATGTYAISFGALSVTAGLSLWQTIALSALLFSGASQFALVGIIASGGSGAAAVATSTLLGTRNGLYGLQMSRLLGVSGLRRLPAAHLTIDESTAIAVAQPERAAQRLGFWGTGISVYVMWNLMTIVGALAGNALGDPRRFGLDAAAPAALCALMWPRLRSGDARAVAAVAAVIALVVAPHAPAGIPVLVAALAAIVAGVLPRRERSGPEALGGPGTPRTTTTANGSSTTSVSPDEDGPA